MKRQLSALLLSLLLLTSSAHAASLTLDGAPLDVGHAPVYSGSTYVSLRAVVEAVCPDASVFWGAGQANVYTPSLTLAAQPGQTALICNGDSLPLSSPILLDSGRTLVPIRPLASLLGMEVTWNGATGTVELTTGAEAERDDYDDQVYWLSRIISAESQGECWEGKIAVGNVVLNRVASPDFPNTIYGVIFDDRWGGQFEPVRNGTVYDTPTQESIQAAIACLAGENTVGDSLYFLAPELTDNHWTMENRPYVTTIGAHWFYK